MLYVNSSKDGLGNPDHLNIVAWQQVYHLHLVQDELKLLGNIYLEPAPPLLGIFATAATENMIKTLKEIHQMNTSMLE